MFTLLLFFQSQIKFCHSSSEEIQKQIFVNIQQTFNMWMHLKVVSKFFFDPISQWIFVSLCVKIRLISQAFKELI